MNNAAKTTADTNNSNANYALVLVLDGESIVEYYENYMCARDRVYDTFGVNMVVIEHGPSCVFKTSDSTRTLAVIEING